MEDHKINIAMADDHAMLRKSLAEMLNNTKEIHVSIDAGNGKELIEKLHAAAGLPDICVLDVNMPDMNGYDTAKEIKSLWPDMKILALSMYETEFNVIKMLRNGANGYMLKDADPAELRKAIVEIHHHGFYHSDLVTGRIINMIQSRSVKELDDKETQFLQLCCTELTYKEIAEKMFKSPRTIDGYRDDLFAKLNITSRTGLVLFAINTGIYSR